MEAYNLSGGVQEVNELPLIEIGDSNIPSEECTICLHTFEPKEFVRTLPCFHMFHQECIDPWISKNFTCPSCNLQVIVPKVSPVVGSSRLYNVCRDCNQRFLLDHTTRPSTNSYHRCPNCREGNFGDVVLDSCDVM